MLRTDASYESLRAVARAAQYRAVLSVPLIAVEGAPVGMLSAHFANVHKPTATDLGFLNLFVLSFARRAILFSAAASRMPCTRVRKCYDRPTGAKTNFSHYWRMNCVIRLLRSDTRSAQFERPAEQRSNKARRGCH